MKTLVDLAALATVYLAGVFFCSLYALLWVKRREFADGLGANRRLARLISALPATFAAALFFAALWFTVTLWK